MLRQFRERMRFGGGGDGGGRGRGTGRNLPWPIIAGVFVALWLITGVYTLDEGQQAVITRFGDYHRSTGPGIHMHLPTPIEGRQVVNMTGQRTTEIGFETNNQNRIVDNPDESLMITSDRNIVQVQFRVIYNIKDAEDFVFNVRQPDAAVEQVAESAMREIIGQRELEPIITTARAEIEQAVETLTQSTLDDYQSGVQMLAVELLPATAPPEVIEAFNDVVNARQDAETAVNNANRDTARIVNEAQGYRERVVSEAQGEAERFVSVYSEYRQAPQVTRDRLYLETMERVYGNGNLIILDQRGGAVPYLPLDGMVRRTAPAQNGGAR